MSNVEAEYQTRMDALSGTQRVARSAAMLKWTREMLARQIISEEGKMSKERLHWKTALRLYSSDATICRWIENRLADVSD